MDSVCLEERELVGRQEGSKRSGHDVPVITGLMIIPPKMKVSRSFCNLLKCVCVHNCVRGRQK